MLNKSIDSCKTTSGNKKHAALARVIADDVGQVVLEAKSMASSCLCWSGRHCSRPLQTRTKHIDFHVRPATWVQRSIHSKFVKVAALNTPSDALALLSIGSTDWLYEAGQYADQLVSEQLSTITPLTYLIVLASGLATSLSPCTLSVLPLTIGYIGGYAGRAEALGSDTKDKTQGPPLAIQAISFSLGLATTLAALGLLSSSIGAAYGAIGDNLPVAVSLLAILMGLNLLEVLPLSLPSLNIDTRETASGLPPALQAYLAGLAFALAASPCSTPVLATLLAWVATSQDPVQGATLLLAYTTGYVAPLLVAATVTGSLKQLLALRQFSAWITPASGALLVGGGTYTLLSRLAT